MTSGFTQRVGHGKHESRRNVSRPEVDDSDKRRAGLDGGPAEGKVMREDDASLGDSSPENVSIRSANESFLGCCVHATAARSKTSDDIGSDVLIGKKRILERLHAVIFSSQVCSPLSTPAAYRKAAARPSSVS